MTALLKRLHHVALSVGDAAKDREFHEELLGLRMVGSSQVPYRGEVVTRQVYDTGSGEAGTLLLCLCLGESAKRGRRGSGAAKVINFSVGAEALDFWRQRLYEAHVESSSETVLDSERVSFVHPSGIEYSLVAVDGDGRPGGVRSEIPPELAIRGLYSVTISLLDVREMTDFLTDLAGADHAVQDRGLGLFLLDGESPGARVELLHEPYRALGTWRYAAGTVHHVGFEVGSSAERARLREELSGCGYTDVSGEVEEAGFSSVSLRAPGGVLVDLVCSSGGDVP